MSTITYEPDHRTLTMAVGESILEASIREGVPHVHVCGGNAQCSTCRVIVLEGLEHCPPRNKSESALVERLGFSRNIRLACQTRPLGDITVRRAVLDKIDQILIRDRLEYQGVSRVGIQKEMTLLFADIAGYTTFTETSQPYDVVHTLSRYFYLMGKIIRDHKGHIIDYQGDGLFAVFEEGSTDEHALQAVRAGKQMLEALDDFNEYMHQFLDQQRFKIRIGVHTGLVIVGSIGIDEMRKETVIGDAVNFASRIETANKELGTQFLISQATFETLNGREETKRSFVIEVKGKEGQYTVYEVA